jgi:hypothetical protein
VDLSDEIANHGLGHLKIRDDAIFHGADGLDISRGLSQHEFGIFANSHDPVGTSFVLANGYHRRFTQDNPSSPHVNERICGPKVYSQIIGEPTENAIPHH